MSTRPKLTLTSVTDATAPPEHPSSGQTDEDAGAAGAAESEARTAAPTSATHDAPVQEASSTASAAADPAPGPRPTEPDTAADAAPEPHSGPWRSWGPFVRAVGFKWPAELADELDDRRHDLREPVGLMVVAAVTHLLDQDDETIHALIDRAEDAKPRDGRRRRR
jgi:hypothetical protein